MTPEQFVKEWLPEYEKRLQQDKDIYFVENCQHANVSLNDGEFLFGKNTISPTFYFKHFPEAIEAFVRHVWDQACRDMREECQEIFDAHYKAELIESLYYRRLISKASILEFKLTGKDETKNE